MHEKDSARRTTSDRRPNASADGDGACGAPIEPGVAGRTAFTLRVQTGCEERCSLLHHPDDARRRPQPAGRPRPRRSRARGGRGLQGDRAHGRAPGFVRPRPHAVELARSSLLRALDASPADVTFRISSLEPMDCTRGDRRARRGERRPLRAALPPAAAARERPHARARCGGRTRSTYYRRLVDAHRRPPAARLDRHRHDRRLSRARPTTTSRANLDYLPASPLSHLHVFPYSDRPGTAATAMPRQGPRRRRSASAARACARSAPSCRDASARRRSAPCGPA